MNRITPLLILSVATLCGGCVGNKAKPATATLQDGDILFQSLPHSPLVDTIEGCTGSPFSHCGIAHRSATDWTVIEAIGPVREIPLKQWVQQSRDGHFTAYRLREPYRHFIPQIIAATRVYFGRPYDAAYEFDDEKSIAQNSSSKPSAPQLARILVGFRNWANSIGGRARQ